MKSALALISFAFLITFSAFSQGNNPLCCGSELVLGGSMESGNKKYFLVFQQDRNLVVYKKIGNDAKPLWASSTNNRVNKCVMQADGNLVLYNNSSPVWASNTYGNPNAKLYMQDDGNLVIYNSAGKPVWASNTAQPAEPEEPTNPLCCDRELPMGKSIASGNGLYFLVFQNDRNLVVYKKVGNEAKPLWASSTNNRVNRCVMQADGNLVLYNDSNPIWSSNTYGNPNAKLYMQDDGNLVIYNSAGKPTWASNTAQPAEPEAPVNPLCCDRELPMGKSIASGNGLYFLVFQNDRNLVVYKKVGNEAKPLWASSTNNRVNRCIMQADGNLVLYNDNNPIWSSNTYGNPNAKLYMQDDGNLVIYNSAGKPIWASNTMQPK